MAMMRVGGSWRNGEYRLRAIAVIVVAAVVVVAAAGMKIYSKQVNFVSKR